MSIESPNLIDLVATKPDDPMVHLVIADHLGWEDERAHLQALQRKLDTYLEFVNSGQLSKEYPSSVGKGVQIDLVLKHAPEGITQESFLLEVRNRIDRCGMTFTWRSH